MFEKYFRKKSLKCSNGNYIPAGNIFCVGRNYKKHIEELNSKDLGEPVIFNKIDTSLIQGNCKIPYPDFSQNVHHEVELAIIIGKEGKNIKIENALKYVSGYAIALDLTLRDLQNFAKKEGTPWFIAKAFDFSCPISLINLIDDNLNESNKKEILTKLKNLNIYLEKNGEIVQKGNTSMMIFSIEYLISYLSNFFTLKPGDIILTGTPEGVGPIYKGDKLIFWSDITEKVEVNIV